jgi:hypothetical protein
METIMTKQPPMLEERIDVALHPDAAVTSADLAALIEEIESDIAKADQLWTLQHESSLDPEAARQVRIDATLAANGLRPLLPELQARYEQVHEQEQAAAWRAAREAAWLTEYHALKSERDAVAEELREVYPDAARKIANVLGRIAINDEALAELHRSRPDGLDEHYLRSAELHARKLESFTNNTPSLLTSVHLFDWDTGHQIWPLRRSPLASGFVATGMQVCDRRFTADWAKDKDRRAAARQAEQQRMADFYARQTQQQEERENAKARERFAALQRKNSM